MVIFREFGFVKLHRTPAVLLRPLVVPGLLLGLQSLSTVHLIGMVAQAPEPPRVLLWRRDVFVMAAKDLGLIQRVDGFENAILRFLLKSFPWG